MVCSYLNNLEQRQKATHAIRELIRKPRGAVHRFDNLGTQDVKQLAVISPANMGPAYFREAAEVINAAVGAMPDRAKMMDVFRRHGMTLAAPPHVE